ncbi:MAG: hypothetical protein H7210_10035 [Pyrinomonadaceae bacterium]|nr:hypothetical protein [Phycisphaerales bacterium]
MQRLNFPAVIAHRCTPLRPLKARCKRGAPYGVMIATVAIILAGCAGNESQRAYNERNTRVPLPGGASEAVFLPESTQLVLDEYPELAEAWEGRRDSAIQPRLDQPVLATAEWPEAPRASLDRYRYISIPRQPENILYFRLPREHRRNW